MFDWGVSFSLAETAGKRDGATWVQRVSRSSLGRYKVKSPESTDIPLSSGYGV